MDACFKLSLWSISSVQDFSPRGSWRHQARNMSLLLFMSDWDSPWAMCWIFWNVGIVTKKACTPPPFRFRNNKLFLTMGRATGIEGCYCSYAHGYTHLKCKPFVEWWRESTWKGRPGWYSYSPLIVRGMTWASWRKCRPGTSSRRQSAGSVSTPYK